MMMSRTSIAMPYRHTAETIVRSRIVVLAAVVAAGVRAAVEAAGVPVVVAVAVVDTAAAMAALDVNFLEKLEKPRSSDRGFFLLRSRRMLPSLGDYGTRSAMVTIQPSGSSKANSRMP